MFLVEREGGQEGSYRSAQEDCGDVREPTDQTPSGSAVRVRERIPYGVDLIVCQFDTTLQCVNIY